MIKTRFFWLLPLLLCIRSYGQEIPNVMTPLAPGAVQLDGYLADYMRNSLEHWNMGVVPYREFEKIFVDGRKYFAEGEMWGKAVRSGCMFYRYNHNPRLREILTATVKRLLKTRRSNGSISASEQSSQPDGPGGDLWERTYVLLGLIAYYRWVDQDSSVLRAMVDEADCTIAQIGPPPKVNILDQGWSPNHIESSTIVDPVMLLYQITGFRRYLGFARYIVEAGGAKGYNLITQALNNVPPYKMGGVYPKAYEMMSLFEGLVNYYRATGDRRIKQAVLNLYHNIKDREITLIGNGGGDQPYHPDVYGEAWDNTAFEQTNPKIQRMMETCAGVTWMKLCLKIAMLTGDPSAVDMIEKYVYNGLIGAMKPSGDGFSYVNLLNGVKTNIHGWGGTLNKVYVTCCNLNGPLGLAYIPYLAVMSTDRGPVINLYNAGSATARIPGGGTVRLKLITHYPLTDLVMITVTPGHRRRFSVKLRIPSWSKKTTLKVNGKAQPVTAGTYADIVRTWNPGDTIELKLDMRCRLVDGPQGSDPHNGDYQALLRGPVVLARDENIDSHYQEKATVLSKDGYVKIVPEKPYLPGTRMQFRVPVRHGYIHMVDYASVNNWNGMHITTWIPKPQAHRP